MVELMQGSDDGFISALFTEARPPCRARPPQGVSAWASFHS